MKLKTGVTAGQGLGDVIADFTQFTGIDKLANQYEKLTGKSCGCDERRQKLNILFPQTPLS
jgi:hypothetical protein